MALLLTLAACGVLPRPFEGKPGATAERLARSPPPRLAVPAPAAALLPDRAARAYADAVVAQLQAREVPAVAGPAHKGDWVLDLTAELHGATVVPGYRVLDPSGHSKGVGEAPAVAADAWSVGEAGTLGDAAARSAPDIATTLTAIEAALQDSDPNSLRNRPPRVQVARVTGAPGDGNESLTAQMKRLLPQTGEIVQASAVGADYTVSGTVRTAAEPNGQMRVEVQWVVGDAFGHDLGHVVQLNNVSPGSLSGLWGDVAMVVAEQAAAGVHAVIAKQSEQGRPPPAAASATAAP